MDDTCDRRTSAIVDVGHRTGNGTCSRNTAKQRRNDVGYTLTNELCVRVVMVADHTVCYCGREKTLNGT